MEMQKTYPDCASYLEISRGALLNNINIYKNILPAGVLLGCVLKGNAYGHGLFECLDILYDHVDIIFLINPREALEIRNYEKNNRKKSAKRILVLGVFSVQEALACARQDIEVTLADTQWEQFFAALNQEKTQFAKDFKKLKVHIHVDTGLAREGFLWSNFDEDIHFLKPFKNVIHVQGIMSHFANVEDVTTQEYANTQLQRLNDSYKTLVKVLGLNHKVEMHLGQSAASLILGDSHLDMVRVGIGLYGLWPSKETRISTKIVLGEVPKLKTALRWRCQSQVIKSIRVGDYVGYGCSFRADKDTEIAIFPVGYFDGYPRLVSGKAYVLVNGHRCAVIGRVMMNHIIVDITGIRVNKSSVVATLIGKDGEEIISAETIAEWSQTINYEAVTRIAAHLQRFVVD